MEPAAHRIVREALANALEHASPGEVAVVPTPPREDGGDGAPAVTVTSPCDRRPGSRARLGREVSACLDEGLSEAEAAARSSMAEATVKTHVSRPPAKLEPRSRVPVAEPARELGVTRR